MQVCSDPLKTIRSVGSDQPWCVTLPACYPTIMPYIATNVEYSGQDAANTGVFSSGVNNYDCTNLLESSLCANSQLIQRLRHKIDLYQTAPSNEARQKRQYSTSMIKQHVPNGHVRERVNQSSHLLSSDYPNSSL